MSRLKDLDAELHERLERIEHTIVALAEVALLGYVDQEPHSFAVHMELLRRVIHRQRPCKFLTPEQMGFKEYKE